MSDSDDEEVQAILEEGVKDGLYVKNDDGSFSLTAKGILQAKLLEKGTIQ